MELLKRLLLRPREEERLLELPPTPANSSNGELRPTAEAMIGGGQPIWGTIESVVMFQE